MMPAVKHFDPVIGIDIHILVIPPVGPVPIPHPHIAMIMDPMDFVPVLGATVMVGPLKRGTAGTAGKTIPHIPLGGPFAKPPMCESEIFMGSATVLADGSPMSFTALPVLSCQDVGMISPIRKKPKKTFGMVLPTSMVTAIPSGLPVLVGGPPTIDMMSVAMAGGMKALGKGFKKLRKLQKGSKRMKRVSKKIHRKAKKAMDKMGVPPSARNKVHKSICAITGHPVDVASGKLFTDAVDFTLVGPLSIEWERTWFSTSTYQGPLGHGWHHSYDVALMEEDGALAVRMADGRPIAFPILEQGEVSFNRDERMTLIRDSNGYAMDAAEGLRYRFCTEAHDGLHLLYSLTEKTMGSSIRFSYSIRGELCEIMDSVGRFVRLEYNSDSQITKILLPHPDKLSLDDFYCAAEYHYREGELIAAEDALKHRTEYRYQNHLLVQETLKSGLNFYFEFDRKDHNARCIKTWGDNNIYLRHLEYDLEKNITKVYNSHNHLTTYHHDGALPHRIINAQNYISLIGYNDYFQIITEVDELGKKTQYEYDDLGNTTKHVHPDGSEVALSYDGNNNITQVTDVMGENWQYVYNNQNQLVEEVNPQGHKTLYYYNETALASVTDPAGNRFSFDYDQFENVRSISDSQGVETQWEYDRRGNILSVTDPKGNQRHFKHDLLGRITLVNEPDGNIRALAYDASDNVVHAKDQQFDIRFAYVGIDRLASRTQNNTTIQFEYDTEEELTAITNEHGKAYCFSHDNLGQIANESGFDGLMREYYRNPLGQVSRIQRPGGRFSDYSYDALGNVSQIKYSDGSSDHYQYRADGLLLGAINNSSSLGFERDALGLVEKEIQGDYWVSSEYDTLGNRTRLQSSFGLSHVIERDQFGEVSKTSVGEGQYQVDFTRDKIGLELQRDMPGGIQSRWQRDNLGRPTRQDITQGQTQHSSKTYVWGVNNRLLKIIDSLNRETVFHHDAMGNLISARYAENGFDWRMPDAVGNLFKTDNKKDREYGPAGQLLASHDKQGTTRYEYDPEGNLTRKTEPNNKVWQYHWNGSGMMSEVVRPNGETVSFAYDPLGRRVSKQFKNKTTRWVWDNNNPLHEWVERTKQAIKPVVPQQAQTSDTATITHRDAILQPLQTQGPPEGDVEAPITWLFEPDTFVPMAKMIGDEYFSIVSDYLGTPSVMFDAEGQQVWSADISAWGELRSLKGNAHNCPFRWQGQYEDAETGLYYNRFRYYDSAVGQYISQDPIGLDGGFSLYSYAFDTNSWIDPLGLNVSTGRGRDHVTYRGVKNGKPYTGYASAPSSLNLSGDEIVARRYGDNFDKFGGSPPTVAYEGSGVDGKRTARGLEQHHYEQDLKKHKGNKTKVANKQKPVGPNNKNRKKYIAAKNRHLKKPCK